MLSRSHDLRPRGDGWGVARVPIKGPPPPETGVNHHARTPDSSPVRRTKRSRVPPFGLTRAFACGIARRLTSLILPIAEVHPLRVRLFPGAPTHAHRDDPDDEPGRG